MNEQEKIIELVKKNLNKFEVYSSYNLAFIYRCDEYTIKVDLKGKNIIVKTTKKRNFLGFEYDSTKTNSEVIFTTGIRLITKTGFFDYEIETDEIFTLVNKAINDRKEQEKNNILNNL